VVISERIRLQVFLGVEALLSHVEVASWWLVKTHHSPSANGRGVWFVLKARDALSIATSFDSCHVGLRVKAVLGKILKTTDWAHQVNFSHGGTSDPIGQKLSWRQLMSINFTLFTTASDPEFG
jgi:hypothetical protein